MDSKEKIYNSITNFLTHIKLPSHDVIFDITEKVSDILENEKTSYRPAASDGTAGGLVDFTDSELPMIVVPDLHARTEYLLNILNFQFQDSSECSGYSVFDALFEKKINLIFVGDILHSERKTRQRWLDAQIEFDGEIFTGPALSKEMQEGLSLLCALLRLKEAFPENVHILKGNHENIMNLTGNGDFSFKKYANEGEMCKVFIQEYYGDDILYMIHCVERALPLVVAGDKCVVSHAEPAKTYSKAELIDARLSPGVVEGLTWTANDAAKKGSVKDIIAEFTQNNDVVYLAGHRPVTDNYSLRQEGYFIQIHNPGKQNIAIVSPYKKFNPETDIFEVNK